jgi:hypothetical protein
VVSGLHIAFNFFIFFILYYFSYIFSHTVNIAESVVLHFPYNLQGTIETRQKVCQLFAINHFV